MKYNIIKLIVLNYRKLLFKLKEVAKLNVN